MLFRRVPLLCAVLSFLASSQLAAQTPSELEAVLRTLEQRERAAETRDEPVAEQRVVGLLSRVFANSLDREQAYRLATYHFGAATRDDAAATGNRWHLGFHNGGADDGFSLRFATEDFSLGWDLGPLPFSLPVVATPALAEAGRTHLRAVPGHVYALHIAETEYAGWVALQVLDVEPGAWLVFRWVAVADPSPWQQARDRAGGMMANGALRIQLRAGAGGGNPNRLSAHGVTSVYVDELVAAPIDLTPPIGIDERCRGHLVGGGQIPQDRVWAIRRVTYRGRAAGDSNGGGAFVLQVGAERVVDRSDTDDEIEGSLRRRVLVRRGEEHRVFAEVANSSQCDVAIEGYLWPAGDLKARRPRLPRAEGQRADALLRDLAGSDAEAALAAERALLDYGPAVASRLRARLRRGAQADLRERLEDMLTFLVGGG